MPKGPFLASEFVSSQFSTAADKAAFGNALLHFLESGCNQELFTRSLYNRSACASVTPRTATVKVSTIPGSAPSRIA